MHKGLVHSCMECTAHLSDGSTHIPVGQHFVKGSPLFTDSILPHIGFCSVASLFIFCIFTLTPLMNLPLACHPPSCSPSSHWLLSWICQLHASLTPAVPIHMTSSLGYRSAIQTPYARLTSIFILPSLMLVNSGNTCLSSFLSSCIWPNLSKERIKTFLHPELVSFCCSSLFDLVGTGVNKIFSFCHLLSIKSGNELPLY